MISRGVPLRNRKSGNQGACTPTDIKRKRVVGTERTRGEGLGVGLGRRIHEVHLAMHSPSHGPILLDYQTPRRRVRELSHDARLLRTPTHPVCFPGIMSASCPTDASQFHRQSSTEHITSTSTSLRVPSHDPSFPHLHLTIPVQHPTTLPPSHSPAKSPKQIALPKLDCKATRCGSVSRGVAWGNTRERGCRTACARVTDRHFCDQDTT
jgi:hypothetical protein